MPPPQAGIVLRQWAWRGACYFGRSSTGDLKIGLHCVLQNCGGRVQVLGAAVALNSYRPCTIWDDSNALHGRQELAWTLQSVERRVAVASCTSEVFVTSQKWLSNFFCCSSRVSDMAVSANSAGSFAIYTEPGVTRAFVRVTTRWRRG